jgi:hypothetical protein
MWLSLPNQRNEKIGISLNRDNFGLDSNLDFVHVLVF